MTLSDYIRVDTSAVGPYGPWHKFPLKFTTRPSNHGAIWTNEHKVEAWVRFLTAEYHDNKLITEIAEAIGRQTDSALERLRTASLIEISLETDGMSWRAKYRNFNKVAEDLMNPRSHLDEVTNKVLNKLFPESDFPLNAVPTTSKGTTMDKNLAALLKEDTFTTLITFDENATPKSKPYTFIADIPLTEGDVVVVDTQNGPRIGNVLRVDDGLNIEPNSEIKYRWVIAKVDMTEYKAKQEKLDELEKLLAQGYRANLRRSFAQAVLAELPDEARAQITGLLK